MESKKVHETLQFLTKKIVGIEIIFILIFGFWSLYWLHVYGPYDIFLEVQSVSFT